MGNCRSSDSTEVVPTAKLILHDGRLMEFTGTISGSRVLQKDPTCFVCNADDMRFDEYVSAIKPDEELQPGNLYFALPLFMLRRPLSAEEMAALAVKASAVLVKDDQLAVRGGYGGGCECRKGSLPPVRDGGVRMLDDERKKRKGRRDGEGHRFTSKLSAIAE